MPDPFKTPTMAERAVRDLQIGDLVDMGDHFFMVTAWDDKAEQYSVFNINTETVAQWHPLPFEAGALWTGFNLVEWLDADSGYVSYDEWLEVMRDIAEVGWCHPQA